MALTTTVAGATSDSYVSVADADTILDFKIQMGATDWDAAAAAKTEACLKEATKRIDRLPLAGSKSATTQALQFPRSDHTDADGNLEIRERIERACALLALALYEDPEQFDGTAADSVSVPGSFNVSGLSGDPSSLPADVLEELRPFLFNASPGPGKSWSSAGRGWI